MLKRKLRYLTLCLLLCTFGAALAQAQTASVTRQRPLTVTASVTAEQVRFAALTDVAQLRLEVFSANGTKVFDTEFKFGNMLDWNFQDQHGQLLLDGNYQCLVTARDYAGRLIERRGQVVVQAGQASLATPEQIEGALQPPNPLSTLERQDFLALLSKEAGRATTLLAHDGQDGRVVSGSGSLSFRTGDFFAGKDAEQMRLTPEGNLGLGVRAPQYKLDVAGLIRTSEGIMFPDGTVQTTANSASSSALRTGSKSQSSLSPNAPTVTVNSLAKFFNQTTIGDSNVFEVGGFVGIGTLSPQGNLHIFGPANQDLFAGMGPDIVAGPGFNFGYAGGSFGRGAGFFNVRPDGAAVAPNPSLRFATANVQRMIVTNTGNVGIGTLSPASRLTVAGDVTITTADDFRLNGGDFQPLGTQFDGVRWVDTGGTIQAHIHRFGAVDNRLYFTNAGTGNLTGLFIAQNATSFTSTSDERLKTDIEPVTGILEKIKNIRVVGFNMASLSVDQTSKKAKINFNAPARTMKNGKVIKHQIGSIAQDWVADFPELVVEPGTAEQYYGLDYDRIGVVALGAVKELSDVVTQKDAEIKALKADNAALQQRNAELDNRLKALEQAVQQLQGQSQPSKRQQ